MTSGKFTNDMLRYFWTSIVNLMHFSRCGSLSRVAGFSWIFRFHAVFSFLLGGWSIWILYVVNKSSSIADELCHCALWEGWETSFAIPDKIFFSSDVHPATFYPSTSQGRTGFYFLTGFSILSQTNVMSQTSKLNKSDALPTYRLLQIAFKLYQQPRYCDIIIIYPSDHATRYSQ